MENILVEKSYFCSSGVSVQEFQQKIKAQEFWGKIGTEYDKTRLMAPDSELVKAFMKWAGTEAAVLEMIKISLQYREDEKLYSWKAADLKMEHPFMQIHGKSRGGNDIMWFTIKHSDTKLLEVGKKAMSYYFECFSRGKPNKPVKLTS